MFVVTNRKVDEDAKGLKAFGETPSELGPNELRLVEVHRVRGEWRIKVIPNELTPALKREVGITKKKDVVGSEYAAERLLSVVNPRMAKRGDRRREGKNLLVFVHGFNNNMKAVLDRMEQFSNNFGVEVLAFSWPADGGGTGVFSYKSDKRDAKASVGAMDRTLAKIDKILQRVREKYMKRVLRKADEARRDAENRERRISELIAKECPFTVNLLLHSMGNYLYKHLLLSSASEGTGLSFDNVILAAADVNNRDHALWVDRIRCRKRVYITINENDIALGASRAKAGEEQLARLGHYRFNLYANQATYVDFSSAKGVDRSHAYFEGDPLKNCAIKGFFRKAVNGEIADLDLDYDAARRTYSVT